MAIIVLLCLGMFFISLAAGEATRSPAMFCCGIVAFGGVVVVALLGT